MNQNWQKARNYRKFQMPDGSVRYVVTVGGADIEVTEDVFTEYARHDRYERYQEEKSAGKLLSIDRIIDEDAVMDICPDITVGSAEDAYMETAGRMERQAISKKLQQVLLLLTEQERHIITTLYLDGRSERDLARELGVSQPAIHKRQTRILLKLKNLLNSL